MTSTGQCGNDKYSIECIMKIERNKPKNSFGMKIFKINKEEKIISILCPLIFGGIEWIINKIEDNEEIIDRGYEELNLDHEGFIAAQ